MKTAALVVAAGKGNRMGALLPKQFLTVKGKPILQHTLEALVQCHAFDEVVMVVAPDWIDSPELRNIVAALPFQVLHIVSGGKERADSVYNGLKYLAHLTGLEAIVMVHDGVRPFIDSSLIHTMKESAIKYGSGIPVVPIKDSLRMIDNETEGLTHTVNRNQYLAVQTPQAFQLGLLLQAFEKAGEHSSHFTDEASLFEHFMQPIKTTKGSDTNIKITTPFDLLVAEAYLSTNLY